MSKKSSMSAARPRAYKNKLWINLINVTLIVSLFTVSIPAAPQIVVDRAQTLAQDARFVFYSSSLALSLPGYIRSWFKTKASSPQSEINHIEILPGSVTVNQGEVVGFTAIAFDDEKSPLSGHEFKWRVEDTGRGFAARSLADGRFEANVPGKFTITVNGGGQQAEATVIVNPSEALNFNQEKPDGSQVVSVSSRTLFRDALKNSNDGSPADTSSLLPEEPGNLPGNPPGGPADDGASNGNFQFAAPVVSLGGRGLDLSLNMNYNSRLWTRSGAVITYDKDNGFPGPGWSLGFGKVMDMGANGGSLLIDADGTHHSYTGTIFPGFNGSSKFQGYTVNGKFIDYISNRDNNGIYAARAYYPNGTYIDYGAKGSGAVYPTYIRDVQGNYITVTYRNNQGPAINTITDSLGRVITFNYDSLSRLISITAPKMQQGSRTLLRIHYKPLPLNYSFLGSITPIVSNGSPFVVDSIYYPGTGTGYWLNDPDSYSTYGMLTKVTEQRGMGWTAGYEEQGLITPGQTSKQSSYNYPLNTTNATGRTNGVDLTNAPTYTTLTESWAERDVNEDAVTTYDFNNSTFKWDGTSNSPARMVSVTHPNGVINRQYSYRTPGAWTNGLVFFDETIVMNGSTEVQVSSSMVSWQLGDYQAARPSWAEKTNENGNKIKTVYDYGSGLFNQVLRSCDYDHNGATLRCTNATYENSQAYKGTWTWMNTGGSGTWVFSGGRHIFNLVKTQTVENPDGSIASRIDYEYDNYQNQPLVNTPGVVQHAVSHNPHTTETVPGPNCLRWETMDNLSDPNPRICVEYEQISAFDSSTNARGNITKTTNYSDTTNANAPTGAINQTRSYDITGNLRTNSSDCCDQTAIDYTIATQYAYPTSQTNGSPDPASPHRITTSSVYDFATGLAVSETDANGRTSTVSYNAESLRPEVSTSPTGATATFIYDDLAMKVTEEVAQSNGKLSSRNIKYLNGIGLIRREETYSDTEVWDIVETKYTKVGEEWKQSRPYRTGDTPQWTEMFYDSQGRIWKTVEPNGSETKVFYNETQRPDSASTLPGDTIRISDAWGRERWVRYDQEGRIAEAVEPNPNGNGSVMATGSLMTKYTRDTFGKINKVEQGSQTRTFKYDSVGRLTRQKMAEQTATLDDSGAFVGAGAPTAKWTEALYYDSRSNLTLKTDARGVRTFYSYSINGVGDPLNRLQTVAYDTSGPLEPNQTIYAVGGVSYSYMTTGDKTRISQIRTDGILTENYGYDAEGRVSDYSQTVDYRQSYPMTVSYLYDSLNRVTDFRYPAAYGLTGNPRKLIQHNYKFNNYLNGMSVDGTEVASGIVYNAAKQITSINVGAVGANQETENFTFDQQTGLLTNQKVQRGAQTLLDLSYDYNRNNAIGSQNGKTGHLTKIINNLDQNKNREFEFDALGRLTKAKGGTTGNLWQQNYSYDRYGNRTNVTATGVAADNSPIPLDGLANLSFDNASNRITTSGYQYDNAGNQTRSKAEDGSWLKYEYDAANRLRVIRKDDGTLLHAYQYGSSNERLMDLDYVFGYLKIFASGGGTTLCEYTEYTGTIPTWTKSNVYLGDSQFATVTPNGAGGEVTEYNHPDRLGIRLTTNQQTGSYSEQTTLPFGTALNAETTGAQTKRFTTYERSALTGLDYAVNRTYDSKLGRFTQVDPIGMSAVDLKTPQTLNLYAYCGNDPVNHIDPNGLFWGSLFKAIGKFFKKLLKWVAVALTVAVAVLTVIYAPYFFTSSLKLIFGVIAAIASAASTVLNAFGLSKAAAFLGIIAAAASLGTSILAFRSAMNWKTFLALVASAATLVSRTLNYYGFTKLGLIFDLIGSVAGFVSSGLTVKDVGTNGKKVWDYGWDSSIWKIIIFIRGTVEKIARIAGATRFADIVNIAGIVDDVGNYYNSAKTFIQRFFSLIINFPNTPEKLSDFWSNKRTQLTGSEATKYYSLYIIRFALTDLRDQLGRINSGIRRIESAVVLAR